MLRRNAAAVLLLLLLFTCTECSSLDVSTLFRKGEAFKAEKRYTEAIDAFEAAATHSPLEQAGLKARVEVGRCIFAQAGDAALKVVFAAGASATLTLDICGGTRITQHCSDTLNKVNFVF